MKKAAFGVRLAAVLGTCLAALSGCGYGPNTLRVVISKEAILAPMVGHTVYCSVIDLAVPAGSNSIGFGSESLTTTEQSKTITIQAVPNPSGHDAWQGVPGTEYGLAVWVDLNDNYPASTSMPESGIDYVTSPEQVTFVATSDFLGTEVTIEQFVRAL
jgi:hypothetical protein